MKILAALDIDGHFQLCPISRNIEQVFDFIHDIQEDYFNEVVNENDWDLSDIYEGPTTQEEVLDMVTDFCQRGMFEIIEI